MGSSFFDDDLRAKRFEGGRQLLDLLEHKRDAIFEI
jgi:hypothetical protein